jgi:hypothetical protein
MTLPHASIDNEEELVFFFCIEAIEKLMLLQGIAAGESISRTSALRSWRACWFVLKIRDLSAFKELSGALFRRVYC